MFRHRNQLRRWSARVLLLWLFGIGVGIANACLAASAVGPHGYAPAAAALQNEAGPASNPSHHHDAHRAHGDEAPAPHGPASQVNCQDFCDKAANSMPTLKPAPDEAQPHALPPSAAATAPAVPVPARLQPWLPRRDGVWALPIPIPFLRLTI